MVELPGLVHGEGRSHAYGPREASDFTSFVFTIRRIHNYKVKDPELAFLAKSKKFLKTTGACKLKAK